MWKVSATASRPKVQFRRVSPRQTVSFSKMDAVAMAPEGSPMDDFKAREQSPMINKDNSPSKKSNIRKRTKTGCMSECDLQTPSAFLQTLLQVESVVDAD